MKVNGAASGVNIQAGQMGLGQEDDAVSKNLKRQIDSLQKQLQELSANTQMGGEEKMKKRQELQKQISDLNIQLRQHQLEQRKEEQQKAKQQEKASSDNIFESGNAAGKTKGDKGTGLSQGSMEAMISADASMKQAAKQGSVATKMEGRAGVLETEIALDSARNGNVDAKKEELAKTKQKAAEAKASQLSTLGEASQTMKEAADSSHSTEETAATEKTAEKDAENAKINGNAENSDEEKDGRKDGSEDSALGANVDVRI